MNDRVRELIGHIDVNAKVRELAEQSGCKIDKLGYGEGNLEKFAELIVKECSKIAYQNDVAKFTRDGYVIGQEIEKHFGVE